MSPFPPHELACALKPFYESFGVGPAILDIQSAARCKLIGSLWSKQDCARLAFQSAMIPSLSFGGGHKAEAREIALLESQIATAEARLRTLLDRKKERTEEFVRHTEARDANLKEHLLGIYAKMRIRERQAFADRQHDLLTESRARHVRV